MRDHALEWRIAEALAADPRVDDDTIAVECGASGYTVLRGSAAPGVSQLRNELDVPFVARVEDEIRVVA